MEVQEIITTIPIRLRIQQDKLIHLEELEYRCKNGYSNFQV